MLCFVAGDIGGYGKNFHVNIKMASGVYLVGFYDLLT